MTLHDVARNLREQARQHRRAAAVLEEQIARIEKVINAAQTGEAQDIIAMIFAEDEVDD